MKRYEENIQKWIDQARKYRLSNAPMVLEAARFLRDKAKELDDRELLGFADYSMACAYFVLNDSDSMKHYTNRAEENLIDTDNWEMLGKIYNLESLMDIREGNMATGLDVLFLAMKTAEDHEIYGLSASLNLNAADICMQLENDEVAMHYLLVAETCLDRAVGDINYGYYYVIASSEAANCAKRLGLFEDYQKQKMILKRMIQKYPEYDQTASVLILEYFEAHEQNNFEEEDRLINAIKQEFFTTPDFLNYINELMYVMDILKETKRYHILDEIIVYINESMNGHESVGIMTMVSAFKERYYRETGQKEKQAAELVSYFKYAEGLRSETNRAMVFLLQTRNNLALSERSNLALQQLADTDALTSLPNRRCMNDTLDRWFERAYHDKKHLGVEMIDVDVFKTVNDAYGHSTGDDVLVLLGRCLKEISGDKIFAARYGGDEFVILYDDMSDDEIMKVADGLRQSIVEGIKKAALPQFTISQGILSHIPQAPDKVWDYTSAADDALYQAKKQGRDRIIIIHTSNELPSDKLNSERCSNENKS